jgi:Rps23 Pro-64 3,4-dihydroxylase Tpa1-like proline 4-hydroxylase
MNFFTLIGTVLAVVIIGSSACAEPRSEDIKVKISELIEGKELAIHDLRYDTYVNDDPSVGRVSIAGNLRLLGDRGAIINREVIENEIYAALAQKGFSKDDVERGARSVGLKTYTFKTLLGRRSNVYKPTLRKGTLVPFTAELSFMETVDGFKFEGKLDYEISDRLMSDLTRTPSTDLVYGGAEYKARLAAIEQGSYYHKHTHPNIREKLVEGLLGASLHYYEETEPIARVVDVSHNTDGLANWKYGRDPLGSRGRPVHIYMRDVVLTILPAKDMEINNKKLKAGVDFQINVTVTVSAGLKYMDEICLRARGNRLCYINGEIGFHTAENGRGEHINQYGFISDRQVGKDIVFRVHE